MTDQQQQQSLTAPPWCWWKMGDHLALATPNRGRLIVMDFVRKGLHHAQPRFAVRKGDEGGILIPASELGDLDGRPD